MRINMSRETKRKSKTQSTPGLPRGRESNEFMFCLQEVCWKCLWKSLSLTKEVTYWRVRRQKENGKLIILRAESLLLVIMLEKDYQSLIYVMPEIKRFAFWVQPSVQPSVKYILRKWTTDNDWDLREVVTFMFKIFFLLRNLAFVEDIQDIPRRSKTSRDIYVALTSRQQLSDSAN